MNSENNLEVIRKGIVAAVALQTGQEPTCDENAEALHKAEEKLFQKLCLKMENKNEKDGSKPEAVTLVKADVEKPETNNHEHKKSKKKKTSSSNAEQKRRKKETTKERRGKDDKKSSSHRHHRHHRSSRSASPSQTVTVEKKDKKESERSRGKHSSKMSSRKEESRKSRSPGRSSHKSSRVKASGSEQHRRRTRSPTSRSRRRRSSERKRSPDHGVSRLRNSQDRSRSPSQRRRNYIREESRARRERNPRRDAPRRRARSPFVTDEQKKALLQIAQANVRKQHNVENGTAIATINGGGQQLMADAGLGWTGIMRQQQQQPDAQQQQQLNTGPTIASLTEMCSGMAEGDDGTDGANDAMLRQQDNTTRHCMKKATFVTVQPSINC